MLNNRFHAAERSCQRANFYVIKQSFSRFDASDIKTEIIPPKPRICFFAVS
jgi:hypothetical protein